MRQQSSSSWGRRRRFRRLLARVRAELAAVDRRILAAAVYARGRYRIVRASPWWYVVEIRANGQPRGLARRATRWGAVQSLVEIEAAEKERQPGRK